ncbi:hypothetical protein TIFTF001_007803 [Ficus carica]|uniref:Uncharacterized protein n=1 Tax=Ficus carica TaxID=3494 RepID=A0AA88D2B6_FICCA|nr:hypothetical protein TIFTF001_007803 [Ficus carica]
MSTNIPGLISPRVLGGLLLMVFKLTILQRPEHIIVEVRSTSLGNTSPTTVEPMPGLSAPYCSCHAVPYQPINNTIAQHATPTTLHHLTLDIHYLLLHLSLLLPRHQFSLPDRTDTIFTTRISTNLYLCPPSFDWKGTWHSSSGSPMPVRSEIVHSPGPLRIRPIKSALSRHSTDFPLTPRCFSFVGDQTENDYTRLTTSSDHIG